MSSLYFIAYNILTGVGLSLKEHVLYILLGVFDPIPFILVYYKGYESTQEILIII